MGREDGGIGHEIRRPEFLYWHPTLSSSSSPPPNSTIRTLLLRTFLAHTATAAEWTISIFAGTGVKGGGDSAGGGVGRVDEGAEGGEAMVQTALGALGGQLWPQRSRCRWKPISISATKSTC